MNDELVLDITLNKVKLKDDKYKFSIKKGNNEELYYCFKGKSNNNIDKQLELKESNKIIKVVDNQNVITKIKSQLFHRVTENNHINKSSENISITFNNINKSLNRQRLNTTLSSIFLNEKIQHKLITELGKIYDKSVQLELPITKS